MINYHYNDVSLNKHIVDKLSAAYLSSKYFVNDKVSAYNQNEHDKRHIVFYIENVINNNLSDNDKFIITNEVMLGKRGTWYHNYLSPSTYYRHRKSAYANFLSCLDR